MSESIVSGLEIAKLFASLLTPIIAGTFAIWIARSGVLTDKRKSINQELIKQRMSVYKEVAPKLNDIICCTNFIGPWRNFTPQILIENKRFCDREMHIYRTIFTDRLFNAYMDLIKSAFSEFNGYGQSAKIRIDLAQAKKHWSSGWDKGWDAHFSHHNNAGRDIYLHYTTFMALFAEELGVK